MENTENTQITEGSVPINERNESKVRRGIRLGDKVEQICMSTMATGLVTSLFVQTFWGKTVVAGICAVVFLTPFVIKALRRHHGLYPKKIYGILKKQGFDPMVADDGIRWISKGKECILRLHSYCQVEISREYAIPPIQAVIDGNEKAAIETMKEVYLAKVSVRKDNEGNRLAFSTESLCVSVKEFLTYLPMCLEILDLAENRQQEHIAEIRERGTSAGRMKIGFLHSDGEIR